MQKDPSLPPRLKTKEVQEALAIDRWRQSQKYTETQLGELMAKVAQVERQQTRIFTGVAIVGFIFAALLFLNVKMFVDSRTDRGAVQSIIDRNTENKQDIYQLDAQRQKLEKRIGVCEKSLVDLQDKSHRHRRGKR